MRKLAALALALCLVFGAMCAMAEKGATTFSGNVSFHIPTDSELKDTKVGNMNFRIPVDAVSDGDPIISEGLEAHTFTNNEHMIIIATLDLDTIEANVTPAEGQEFFKITVSDSNNEPILDSSVAQTSMFWALQLIAGMDAKSAIHVTQGGSRSKYPLGYDGRDLPNGEEQLYGFNNKICWLSTSREGTGIFVIVMVNQGVAEPESYDHYGLALSIGTNVRIADTATQE